MIFETLNRKKHLYMYAFSILYSKCISIPKFSYLSYQYTTFIVLYIADDVRLIVLDIFVYPYPTCVIFFFFKIHCIFVPYIVICIFPVRVHVSLIISK